MAFASLEELFAKFDTLFNLPETHPVLGPYQINLTGSGGGSWYVTISGTKLTANSGTIDNPISVIEAVALDYLDVHNGNKTYADLLSDGKMKILKGHGNIFQLSNYSTKKSK